MNKIKIKIGELCYMKPNKREIKVLDVYIPSAYNPYESFLVKWLDVKTKETGTIFFKNEQKLNEQFIKKK